MNEPNELLDSLREIAARTYRNELGIADILKGQNTIMATLSDVQAAVTSEHADVSTLTGLVQQLLTAFANGQMSSTDAQALLDKITPDDTSVKSSIAAIKAALPTPPPSETPTPVTPPASGTPAPVTPTPTGDTSAQ